MKIRRYKDYYLGRSRLVQIRTKCHIVQTVVEFVCANVIFVMYNACITMTAALGSDSINTAKSTYNEIVS